MSRRPSVVAAGGSSRVATIVLAACSGSTATPAPSRQRPTRRRTPARRRPRAMPPHIHGATRTTARRRATARPARSTARPYTGNVQEDHGARRADRRVPAVQPGRRVPVEDRVQRLRHRGRRLPRRARGRTSRSSTQPNGTGPYKLNAWEQGQPDGLRGQRRLLGRRAPQTPNLEFRWSDQAAQRLLELQSGTVDGIDNPGTDDIADDQGRQQPHVLPARGPEHLLPRLQQHDQAVGQREGPPGDRHGHRPPADRRQLLPATGSEVATHFTPCADPVRLRGRRRRATSTPPRPRRSWPRPASRRLQDHKLQFRDAVRGYLPGSAADRDRDRRASSRPTSASTPPSTSRSPARSSTPTRRARSTASSCSAGAPTIPDPTNFLDYHFGVGLRQEVRRAVRRHRRGPQRRAPDAPTTPPARRPTPTANNLIKQHVPVVIVAHGGSGTAFKADVDGRPLARRSATRSSRS